MGNSQYDGELDQLAETFSRALSADIDDLKAAVASVADSSVIAVGSGGSYTVASLLCNLHEAYTGRVSRPSTPLEIVCNPTLASSSPVFLISAEGKNPDIVEALERARRHTSRTVHVLTNRSDSVLMKHVRELPEVRTYVFELTKKDGYLATNSLLLDATIVARAYGELDENAQKLPRSFDDLRVSDQPIAQWVQWASGFVDEIVRRKGLIVVFSPLLRPVAADLESKLAESALLYCQVADIRSFAHGRHLWLSERPEDCAILAVIEPGLESLWQQMAELMPPEVPVLSMKLAGARPRDLLAGLVAQMHIVSLIAQRINRDPARPDVQTFGRQLYYLDLPKFISAPEDTVPRGEQSKYEVLGARWPSTGHSGALGRSLESFERALSQQTFRAIVFDYDGTISSSQSRDAPPSPKVVSQIERLLAAGVSVGIASGRGDSIQGHLRNALPSHLWKNIYLGLYNGGWIGTLGEELEKSEKTNEFLIHVRRIVGQLQALGVPIKHIRETYPYQVSIRLEDGVNAENMWFVVADALKHAGLDSSTVVRSKHSVDVLASGVDKSHLVAHMAQACKVDPYEIVTMGDQGAWPGNDSSLLEHRFSLSVDQPTRRIDRGWKLAPHHKRDVDATLWYLERTVIAEDAEAFRFTFE